MSNARTGVKGFVAVPLEQRFWAKVVKGGPDECWLWIGAKARHGYGMIAVNGKHRKAHRVAWEIANGATFPEGMSACHTCDNPPCVNPAHIWPGTMKDNLRDASKKGRTWHPPVKTHCPNGHPYEGDNLYMATHPGGLKSQVCRTCQHIHNKKWREKRKAALTATSQEGQHG